MERRPREFFGRRARSNESQIRDSQITRPGSLTGEGKLREILCVCAQRGGFWCRISLFLRAIAYQWLRMHLGFGVGELVGVCVRDLPPVYEKSRDMTYGLYSGGANLETKRDAVEKLAYTS